MLEGDWVRVVKRGHHNACCNCGMEHRYFYRTDEHGGIEFRAKVIKPGRRQ